MERVPVIVSVFELRGKCRRQASGESTSTGRPDLTAAATGPSASGGIIAACSARPTGYPLASTSMQTPLRRSRS